jgi:dinuclear metal center YbgI/SA1388 family protein
MPASKKEIIEALNKKLEISSFHDLSNNGLQVDSPRDPIAKVCSGVDGSLAFFKAAKEAGADLVICHHGISWGDSLKQITGSNYRLVSYLIENKMALWACHLPIDAHPILGNNAQICDTLKLVSREPFGEYHGQSIGFSGSLEKPLSRTAFQELLKSKISPNLNAHLFGNEEIKTVGVISGGAPELVAEAIEKGLDAYITGEANLISHNLCQEGQMNMFAMGHYATERFGIRAVGDWLSNELGIEHEFIDLDIPY